MENTKIFFNGLPLKKNKKEKISAVLRMLLQKKFNAEYTKTLKNGVLMQTVRFVFAEALKIKELILIDRVLKNSIKSYSTFFVERVDSANIKFREVLNQVIAKREEQLI
jgi:hypothetical protein